MGAINAKLRARLATLIREGFDPRGPFADFDPERTGEVTRREFGQGCRALGLPLSANEVSAVASRYAAPETRLRASADSAARARAAGRQARVCYLEFLQTVMDPLGSNEGVGWSAFDDLVMRDG